MRAEPSVAQPLRRFVDLAVDKVEPGGMFCGYASVFGVSDLGSDVVESGAFAGALRRRRACGIRMLYQHDAMQPIGAWSEIREDRRGLFVRGRLTPGVQRAEEVLALLRAGALDGLSIGFRPVRTRRDATGGGRRILEADLWEISVVTFPMQPAARIETVKARRPKEPASGHCDMRRLALTIRQATSIINTKGRIP